MSAPSLTRRALAELLGTGLLVAVVIGSGIMAARLSPHDVVVPHSEPVSNTERPAVSV